MKGVISTRMTDVVSGRDTDDLDCGPEPERSDAPALERRALRESEERYRAFVTASTEMVYRMSPDWSEMRQLDGRGYLADTVEPTDDWWDRYIHPNDRATIREAIERAICTRSMFELEHRVIRPDGSLGWVLSRAVPMLRPDGSIREWIGAGSDVSDRHHAEDALRKSEERFREFADNSADAIWIVDAEAMRLEYLSPAFERIWGVSRNAIFADLGVWAASLHPDDREHASVALPRLLSGGVHISDYRIVRPDGEVRWIRDTGFPIREDAQVKRVGGIAKDVTDLKQTEGALVAGVDELRGLHGRQQLLLAELQHRVRNTLGIIRSIARRTAETSDTVDDYVAHLDGRIEAFARVQAAVTRDPAGGVDLRSLIEDELLAHATREGRRLEMHGPALTLSPRAAETFSLAVHELTSNAVKHGALGIAEGRVIVGWRLDEDVFSFSWKESGLVLRPQQVKGDGFGMDLLLRGLPYELGADATVDFEPTGLRFSLSSPIRTLLVQ